ncbi:MAG: Na+:solute symporter [Spirochaetes bacterium]|nr:Na+:solute symporter [Spirochaetota bacterium]
MNFVDWLVVAGYFVLTFAVGIFALSRKHETSEDYFLSGRRLPWHLAGLSLVATTFAADTPLAVTGITVVRGIAGNFLWLSLIPAGIMTAIFYARLWRRSGVVTDAEFATLRYSGAPANFLRRFRAAYLAILVNLIIMGWVTTGMAKVLHVFFDYPLWITLGVLYAFTVVYIILSGLWGVVLTDVLQFAIAMVGCIILAIVGVEKVGGLDTLWQQAQAVLPPGHTTIYPWYFSGPVYVVAVWLGVQWWASWYPGFEPGGGGYVVQRLLSTKNENHAVGAAILFNILHFVVRPWPWIITALCAVVALPPTGDAEMLYPRAILAWLPAGLKGLLIAAFLAAFMSTIATHLNWGASYIVNDVVAGTRVAPRTTRGTLLLSRVTILLMALGAIGVSFAMTSVSQGWELILMLSAGTGPVYLVRWYWSRVNAWSEISAMSASFIFSLLVSQWSQPQEIRLIVVALLTTIAWVCITLFTKPESAAKLSHFAELVRPTPWRSREIILFLASIAAIYTAFFAIGELLQLHFAKAALQFVILCGAIFIALVSMRRPKLIE